LVPAHDFRYKELISDSAGNLRDVLSLPMRTAVRRSAAIERMLPQTQQDVGIRLSRGVRPGQS
jgi:hypothetical protein